MKCHLTRYILTVTMRGSFLLHFQQKYLRNFIISTTKKNPFEDLSFILVSPLCFPFCATDQTLPFLLMHESSFCLTLGYGHGFPKLEDTNALLIMGLLLDCSLYEDMKVREHDSLSGFLLYYVRNVSELSSSWQPSWKTRTQAGLMVLSSHWPEA